MLVSSVRESWRIHLFLLPTQAVDCHRGISSSGDMDANCIFMRSQRRETAACP